VSDELRSADEAVDTESVVVVDLVDLVRALPDERQLVLDSLGFGSEHIVPRCKVGLYEMHVSIVSFHLLTTLSEYSLCHFLVQFLNLLGKLDAFGELLSFEKR
jgi:hypothetical protein